jgi:ABC-2 type transport system ATP-binding protein
VEELCDNIALIDRSRKVLDGAVKDIKNQYKTNTFLVEGTGQLLVLSPDFEVVEQGEHQGAFRAAIRLQNGARPNDLLRYLIESVEVHSFQEKIPSINDIFIRQVQENAQAS